MCAPLVCPVKCVQVAKFKNLLVNHLSDLELKSSSARRENKKVFSISLNESSTFLYRPREGISALSCLIMFPRAFWEHRPLMCPRYERKRARPLSESGRHQILLLRAVVGPGKHGSGGTHLSSLFVGTLFSIITPIANLICICIDHTCLSLFRGVTPITYACLLTIYWCCMAPNFQCTQACILALLDKCIMFRLK
jgi:hypothetical protein